MTKIKKIVASVVVAACAAFAVPGVASAAEGKSPALSAYCNSSHGKNAWNLAKTYEPVYFQYALAAYKAGNMEAFKVYYSYYQYFATVNLWFRTVCA